MEVKNRVRAVFITGGGSGLGAAVAQHLGEIGWRIGLAGRRSDALQTTVRSMKMGAQTYPLDVTDADAVDLAIRDFRPDALVCCAAVLGQGSLYEDLTSERFAEVHAINITGTFNACRSAMRLWRDASISGDIVNISSLGGIRGMQKFPGFAAYASSKHAIVGLTEALAIEGRSHSIRINAIAPGTLRTPMIEALGISPKTTPDSIAGTIEFLLDRSRSGPISGTTIEVHCNDD